MGVLGSVTIGCGRVEEAPLDGRPADARVADGRLDALADAAAFTPASLPGLALWLDGDRDVFVEQGYVAAWKDRSSNANHAAVATPANQPTVAPAPINGHAAIRFDGIDDWMKIADHPSLQWNTQDFTIAIVARYDMQTSTTAHCLFNKQVITSPYPGVFVFIRNSTPVQVQLQASVASDGIAAPSGTHVLVVGRRGTKLIEHSDLGAAAYEVSANTYDISAAGIDVAIGGRYQPDPMVVAPQRFAGDIAELVAVTGAMTDAELASLKTYLGTKFGIGGAL